MKYYSPNTLDEAIKILSEVEGSIVFAGGTDILVERRAGKIDPPAVVDIKRIKELNFIKAKNNKLEIGALTSINTILENEAIPPELEALKDAGKVFGCYEIRNRATIGGNIAHASPGGEFVSTLTALDAIVRLYGPEGTREIPIQKFFRGAGKSIRAKTEIITTLEIPVLPNSASAYFRASRTDGMDLAIVNCAVMIRENENESPIVSAAFGAVAPTPLVLSEVNKLLSEGEIERAKKYLFENINPRATSLRATPLSKKILVTNLLDEAFLKARERLKKSKEEKLK